MAEIDWVLFQDTKENLMDQLDGDEFTVENVLQDMKECGYFDIDDDYLHYEDDDYDVW